MAAPRPACSHGGGGMRRASIKHFPRRGCHAGFSYLAPATHSGLRSQHESCQPGGPSAPSAGCPATRLGSSPRAIPPALMCGPANQSFGQRDRKPAIRPPDPPPEKKFAACLQRVCIPPPSKQIYDQPQFHRAHPPCNVRQPPIDADYQLFFGA
jgi:hypothetical protein